MLPFCFFKEPCRIWVNWMAQNPSADHQWEGIWSPSCVQTYRYRQEISALEKLKIMWSLQRLLGLRGSQNPGLPKMSTPHDCSCVLWPQGKRDFVHEIKWRTWRWGRPLGYSYGSNVMIRVIKSRGPFSTPAVVCGRYDDRRRKMGPCWLWSRREGSMSPWMWAASKRWKSKE